MKLNEFTVLLTPPCPFTLTNITNNNNNPSQLPPCIESNQLFLVPYENHHVLRYHHWMASDTPQSEELRRLTASEPLTLDEEYTLQKSWREDNQKLTFILLDAFTWWKCRLQFPSRGPAYWESISMIGDVNIFLISDDDEEENDDCTNSINKSPAAAIGELELMIAESNFRGKGFGRQVVLCILHYAFHVMDLTKLVVKITEDNVASQRLFTSVGFTEVGRNSVFHEVEMSLSRTQFGEKKYLLKNESTKSVLLVNALVDENFQSFNSNQLYSVIDANHFRSFCRK